MFGEQVIYKNTDGFRVLWAPNGMVVLRDHMVEAIMKYGLSETPDYDELRRLSMVVYVWASQNRPQLSRDDDEYFGAIKDIIHSLSLMTEDDVRSGKSAKKFLEGILERFEKAANDHYLDVMSGD
jgi:hypothetical protein